jgi:alkylation response protein AidB-like acyl-CoA dehydrogenase
MDFLPTDDQRALQQGVRELLEGRFPLDRLPHGYDGALWQELQDTGVFDLRRSEADGGLGLGLAEAALVFDELGRACVPGPLVATHLVAGFAEGPVTWLDAAQRPLLVSHLEVARSILVVSDDGARLADSSAAAATPVAQPVDPLTPLHELADPAVGEPVAGAETVARWRREGAVLTAALQVGLAARLTELAVDYAQQREQFGRTIGSFQAVKHICADMLVRTELARAALHAAAVTLDEPSVGDAARAVAGAKLLADEAATANGRACVQVHGGMGFTWEVPVHFFLKRAWLHATEFGTADDHAEDLAELL